MYYPFNCQCFPHIETSQLICKANQLTGFYMRETLAINGLNSKLTEKNLKRIGCITNLEHFGLSQIG